MDSQDKINKILAARWGLYLLLLLIAAALQTTPGFLSIAGRKPCFIPAVCLAVALCEDEFYGALFGAVGGMLWDYVGGRTVGLLAILMLVLCYAVSLVVQMYLKSTFTNFFLLNLAAVWIILSLDFCFFYLMKGYSAPAWRYFTVILPEAVFSAVFSPLFLIAARKISEKTKLPS